MTIFPTLAPDVRASAPAQGRELFVLVAVAQLMASLQFAMIGVALPAVVTDLGTSLRWAGWAVSLFTMSQAVSLPMMGRLSDGFGRRAVFIGGVVLFGVSSLACAAAPNVGVLIAARAFQGIAAGSLLPSTYGIVSDAFPGANRNRVLGLISSIFPIGAIAGPNLGGLLVESVGWRATFLVNVPVAVVVVVWGWLRIPDGGARGRITLDYGGAALLVGSVGSVMIALTEAGRPDLQSPAAIVGALGLAVVFGVAFVLHERRTEHHLVDPALLRREYARLNALNFLYGVCTFGLVSFIPVYTQQGYGLSASVSGLLLTPRALAMIAMSILASLIIHRTGFRLPIRLGLVAMALSAGLLAAGEGLATRSGLGDVAYLAIVVSLLGFGLGFAGPSANQAGLDQAPGQVAALTGLRGMFRALGGAVGTAAIAAAASRSSDPGRGFEHAFGALAVLALAALVLAALVLVRGIPQPAAVTAPSVTPMPYDDQPPLHLAGTPLTDRPLTTTRTKET